MNQKTESFVNIEVVANGYIVRPTVANGFACETTRCIHVFQTFPALTAWLKANLQTPPENKTEK